MENLNYIHKTEDYAIVIGIIETDEKDIPIEGYQVLNTKTNIVETETRILPQAMEYVSQLQAALDASREDAKGPADVSELRKAFKH